MKMKRVRRKREIGEDAGDGGLGDGIPQSRDQRTLECEGGKDSGPADALTDSAESALRAREGEFSASGVVAVPDGVGLSIRQAQDLAASAVPNGSLGPREGERAVAVESRGCGTSEDAGCREGGGKDSGPADAPAQMEFGCEGTNGKGSVPAVEGASLVKPGAPRIAKTRTDIYTTPYKDGRVRYTKVLGREICRLIATGEPLGAICRRRGMPTRKSVFEWLNIYPDFKREYVLARRVARDGLEEEMLEIIDDRSQDVLTLLNEDGMYYKVLNPVAVQRAKARVAVRAKMIEWHMPRKHHPEVDDSAALRPVRQAQGLQQAQGDSGRNQIQYRLTEERRAALMERRKQVIISGAHKEERERYLREAAEAELAKRRAQGDAGSDQAG